MKFFRRICVATGLIFVGIAFFVVTVSAVENQNPDEDVFSAVGLTRILVSTLIATVIASVIGYFVWWLQSRSTRKRVAASKEVADRLASDLQIAHEEKERIADGHKQLLERVTKSESILGDLREQLALMEQAARPLFEAAKIRLIASLTHPAEEFKVPDALLKLTLGPEGYITPELATLLKERETSTHPEVTPEEKLAAAILPNVVELASLEAKVVGPITSQLVSSPVEKKS